jgi:chromosome segregation ATPase
MLDALKDLIDLAKEHGPISAAWMLFFAFVAWIAGYGGKIALNNVRSLLDASTALRQSMADDLTQQNQRVRELNAQLADANANLTTVKAMLDQALDGLRLARDAHSQATMRCDQLAAQYSGLERQHQALQAEMRDTMLALHIARTSPCPVRPEGAT